jgi:hypothetical protein
MGIMKFSLVDKRVQKKLEERLTPQAILQP